MLEVFEPEALNYFTFFHPILSTLSAFRNPILTHLPLSGFLDFLFCVLIAPTPGLAFSLLMPRMPVAALSFSSGRAYLSLNVLPLFLLDPYSDYVGVNISLNKSSSMSFLNVYAPPIRSSPTDGRTDFFSPSILPSSRNLFILGDFNCHHPLWDSKVTSDPCGEEVFDWVISSDLLPLNDPDTPTLLHPSSGSRSSPDISFAPSTLAFSCSWEMLQDLGSDHLPILLSIPLSPVFHPNEHPPSFNFQKACWDGFASYIDSHCPSAEEYSSLSLSSAAALFTSLALNAAKSSIPFGRIKHPPKAWWSAEVEQAVGERCRAFATADRSDEDRHAYISASRRASSVIAKAKAEAWQTTCTSLSPKSVHSLLRYIAGSPSSSSSSPNFPNCSSPRESASVYAAYLRSHFSVSQSKALRSRARGYLTELRRATCSVESHSSFCSPFSPAEFLAAASNLSSSTATGPDKVAYPMLKHLPCSGMDFLLHIFNLSWSSHSFPSTWKTSSIIPIHKMGNLLTLLLPSGLSLSPPAYQSFLNASFYPVFSFFWNLIPFFLPARPASALDGLHLIKFCTFLNPFRMGLTNPGRALGRSCLLLVSLKLLTRSGIPLFSTNLFRLASLLALLVELNLSFLIGALLWSFKIPKAIPFEYVEVFCKDPFLALYFSLSSLMIFRLLCLLLSAALFTLTIWPFGPPPHRSLLRWRQHK